jgi:hypothetical protein
MPTQKELAWLQKNKPDVYAKMVSKVDPSSLPKDKKEARQMGGAIPGKTSRAGSVPGALGPGNDTNVSPGGPTAGPNPMRAALDAMMSKGLPRPRSFDGMGNRKRKGSGNPSNP